MGQVNIRITTVRVGSGFVGVTQLGGITVRGKRVAAGDNAERLAVQNVLWKLAGEGTEDEPVLALELEMARTTLDEELGRAADLPEREALPDPTSRTPANPPDWSGELR